MNIDLKAWQTNLLANSSKSQALSLIGTKM